MLPYSTVSSPQSNQATAGSTTTSSPQSFTNDMRPDTTKDDYERNMAAYAKHYRRSAYGGLAPSLMAGGGGSKPSVVPSPTAPIFTPSTSTTRTNKAARAEAMRQFHIHTDRKMRQLRKLEEDLKEAVRSLDLVEKDKHNTTERVGKVKEAVPSSVSTTSVGSWTDDEVFIPHIKK